MNITDTERGLFVDLLYDALIESAPDSWTDYEGTFATFLRLASVQRLELFAEDTRNEDEMHSAAREIERRIEMPDSGEVFGDGCS